MRNLTLLTDFYELTMMNGYLKEGIADNEACFDVFYRGGNKLEYAMCAVPAPRQNRRTQTGGGWSSACGPHAPVPRAQRSPPAAHESRMPAPLDSPEFRPSARPREVWRHVCRQPPRTRQTCSCRPDGPSQPLLPAPSSESAHRFGAPSADPIQK